MNTQKHILIIEDEVKIAELLKDYLEQLNYKVTMIHDGGDAVAWIKANVPDLIVLDIMLPHVDGLTICREVRKTLDTPIIFLTAKVEEIDRIIGLEIGADDYVCKPFSPREVVARVSIILRRVMSPVKNTNGINIDDKTYQVEVFGHAIDLTAVEFQLFKMMYDQPSRIFSRQHLMDSIYDDHRVVSTRTIDSHIKKLRKKLSLATIETDIIHSVYGVGYKFELPIK